MFLEVPEMGYNLQHSFKQERVPSKKPPKLYHHNNSFNKFASNSFQVISFRNDTIDTPKRRSVEQNNDSYFDKCFVRLAKIGEGSFSEVFKVRSKEDGCLYAIKRSIIPYRSETYRKRSHDEVRYFETFSENENCVTLYKAWEQNGHLYMQLELCETLESHIKKLKNVSEDFYWSILLDLLLGLKALHDRGFIHLDIKLDNVLIDENNTCKLGDFGLVVDTHKDNIHDATEGDSRYIAPEVLDGHFSKAADIFSLGVTMLELVTNLELQSNGPLWQELREGILPSICLNLMSPDFKNIIRWMMEPEPSERPDVDSLLSSPRIQMEIKKRKKMATVKNMQKLYRKARRVVSRSTRQVYNFISQIFNTFMWLFHNITTSSTSKKPDESTDLSDNETPYKKSFSTSDSYDQSLNGQFFNSTPVIRHGYRSRISNFSYTPTGSIFNDSSFSGKSTPEPLSLSRKKLFASTDEDSDF